MANAWRTLHCIGWQHAEPVLRFVVYNLITSKGGPDPYYRPNLARVEKVLDKLPAGWPGGRADRGVTAEAFAPLRQGRSEDACELAVKQLAGGVGARPLWDALQRPLWAGSGGATASRCGRRPTRCLGQSRTTRRNGSRGHGSL